MKHIYIFLVAFLFSVSLSAQETNEFNGDTLVDNSLLDPVIDTLPNINIFGETKSLKISLKYDITYIDTGKKQKNYQKYGFVIEPLELVAKRVNAVIMNPVIIREDNVIEKDTDRVTLFQYMIGNTDWRIKGGHNTKYIKSLNQITSKVISVPYDFDFSGFVETSYSFPQSWTSIEKVTDREYLGYCRKNEEAYLDNIACFLEKKDEIFETIDNFEFLEKERTLCWILSKVFTIKLTILNYLFEH